MWADVTVEISKLEGRALWFTVSVRDPIDEVVATGTHGRFVIDVAKTLRRLQQKQEAFAQAS